MKQKIFEHKSTINTTAQKLMEFHEQPQALKILTPFPVFIQVLKDKKSITEGEADIRMWLGIIPLRWLALHQKGNTATSFKDSLIRGPMLHWTHEHIFEDTPNGAKLTDRITLAHKKGIIQFFTRFAFDGFMLKLLFIYRHWRTKKHLQE